MRENLFRGKKLNGDWVFGSYVKATLHWHKYGIHEDWIVKGVIQNGWYCNVYEKYAVVSATVGQYTGLKDKNGKKIFEGDIVKSKHGEIFSICFDDGAFCFNDDNRYIYALGDSEFGYAYKGICDELEVIGNIHDNPELLEVKK